MSKKKLSAIKKILWWMVAILAIAVGIGGYVLYRQILAPNVVTQGKPSAYLFIPTNSTFEDVVNIMSKDSFLLNKKSFVWVAEQMKYSKAVKPGKYLLRAMMSNKDLVMMLRSGKQTPINVVFNNIRTKQELASRISEQIEAPADSLLNLLNDKNYAHQIGFTPDNVLAMFLPNTYQFYWNTSADQFIRHMKKEYDKFWKEEEKLKAKELGLTPVQVSVLASIVQMETNREDEKGMIAGVYLNRLNKHMRLEADPTLVWALGNFSVTRILNVYKEIDSPYNTYKYEGLPPGPICLPTFSSLNAVINPTQHNYLYFCAKSDFSGYHAFASTYDQHLINAKRFQKALDKRGIRS